MAIIPPKGPPPPSGIKSSGVKLPDALWKELDEVAGLTGWSRNKVIEFLLRHAIDDWNKNERPKLKTPKAR